MRYWKVRELLAKYKNGILSERQARLVEEHIGHCKKCRKILDWYKSLETALLELEPIGISQKSLDESWAKIKRDINRKMRRERLQDQKIDFS